MVFQGDVFVLITAGENHHQELRRLFANVHFPVDLVVILQLFQGLILRFLDNDHDVDAKARSVRPVI
jgi:hypothetical protein